MKRIAIICGLVCLWVTTLSAQCIDFSRKCLGKLDTVVYTHDGRVNAVSITEGDNIDVYKPFFKGRKYRVYVGAENLQGVVFKIFTMQQEVVFDSQQNNNTQVYDFVAEKTANLIISVSAPKIHEGEKLTSGCVAVLVGYGKKK